MASFEAVDDIDALSGSEDPKAGVETVPEGFISFDSSLCDWVIARGVVPKLEAAEADFENFINVAKAIKIERPSDISELASTESGRAQILSLFNEGSLGKDNFSIKLLNTIAKIFKAIGEDHVAVAACEKKKSLLAAKADKAAEREKRQKLPDLSNERINELFAEANLDIPNADMIPPRKVFQKLLRDKERFGGMGYKNLTLVDLAKECRPLDYRATTEEPEGIIDKLKKALEDQSEDEGPKKTKGKHEITDTNEWTKHWLVFSHAAVACGQLKMSTCLNHLHNVLSVKSENGDSIALKYDHVRRAQIANECCKSKTYDPDSELSKFCTFTVERIWQKQSKRKHQSEDWNNNSSGSNRKHQGKKWKSGKNWTSNWKKESKAGKDA